MPDGTALDHAREVAAAIAANGPVAVQAVLRALRATEGVPEREAIRVDSQIGMAVYASNGTTARVPRPSWRSGRPSSGEVVSAGPPSTGMVEDRIEARGPAVDIAEIDLLDRDRFAEGVPHGGSPSCGRTPRYHHAEPGGAGFWVFTRYDDVVAPTGTRRRSRPTRRAAASYPRGPGGAHRGPALAGKLMLFMDPPRHTRYRKLVNRGFTPNVIAALDEHLRDLSVRIVDDR